ncbi:hypothetical protein [Azospirillum sp.]|uniref:hypothetical protein n=1 Tax=Azospirillum sp. TaxID=34012 RepID=UPI002610BB46|nr:hypothetical protein [Azospirillum sp.]
MSGSQKTDIKASGIRYLAPRSGGKEINSAQGVLALSIEVDAEFGDVGMGVLSDGTPYLNQRGLAALCGVMNAHIGTISSQWTEDEKPRIAAIKSILSKVGSSYNSPHVELFHGGKKYFCYPADVCLAILEYYAFDAGVNCQVDARDNFRKLAGSKLKDLIYSQVGYDPTGQRKDIFRKWHDRLALNYQSAPKGHFHVFNEASVIIYELIMAGAEIGDKFVVDISIGQHWSKHWSENNFDSQFGERKKWPHRYPDDHPQAKSNPQESWCYPLSSLGVYREWLQCVYIEGGKFGNYLTGKVKKGEIAPSFAQLAIDTLGQKQIPNK